MRAIVPSVQRIFRPANPSSELICQYYLMSFDAHMNDPAPVQVKSCGFLIFKEAPQRSFLLMRHMDRWDLPKGHVDPGETEMECALRELQEETGILPAEINVDPEFCYRQRYDVRLKRYQGETRRKELVIFLAKMAQEKELVLTEHLGYEWFPWAPPHQIQEKTIDPLLTSLSQFWSGT